MILRRPCPHTLAASESRADHGPSCCNADQRAMVRHLGIAQREPFVLCMCRLVVHPAMNSYFNQFAGCRNSAVAVEPAAPDDAAFLDLRRAVPILTSQYLDLECTHMPTFDGDSAGDTDDGSDADSHSSFLDDAPTGLTADDLAVVADFVVKALPRTAGKLCLLTASPATIAARKRRRIVITSSTSSSPPHHLHASASVITSAAVLTDADAAVAAPA